MCILDSLTGQIRNMSAEIEATGSKRTEAPTKLEEAAEREAKLVESLRKAEEAPCRRGRGYSSGSCTGSAVEGS